MTRSPSLTNVTPCLPPLTYTKSTEDTTLPLAAKHSLVKKSLARWKKLLREEIWSEAIVPWKKSLKWESRLWRSKELCCCVESVLKAAVWSFHEVKDFVRVPN